MQANSLTTMLRPILLISLLLSAHPLLAATFYVAKDCTGGASPPNCSNSNNGTSRQTAKLTIAAGAALLSGGDTLVVGDGIYVQTLIDVLPSGSVGAHTTLVAENRNQAVVRNGASLQSALTISGLAQRHHITLDGIAFDGDLTASTVACTAPNGLPATETCSTIIIRNGTIRDGGGTNPNNGDSCLVGSFINSEITNNDIINCGTLDDPPSGQHGMYMQGDQTLIDGNRITCNSNGGAGIQLRAGGVSGTGAGFIVRNNVIKNCSIGMTISTGWGAQIYNNTFSNIRSTFSNSGTGIANFSYFGSEAKYWNNTFYDIATTCLGLLNGPGGGPVDVEIVNNICYQTTAAITFTGMASATCTTNFNIGGNGVQASACTATLGTTDPRFANAAGGDFRLCTAAGVPHASCVGASAAIDSGTTLIDVDTDIVGTARPQGKGFDLGAYEGTATAGPTRISFATDNFTNSSTALLSSYSAANWAIVYDNGSANGMYVDAATDVAYGTAAWDTGPWIARRADTGTGWLNDQYTSCQVVAIPPTTPAYTSLLAVVVRASTDTDASRDYLVAEMYGSGGGRCVSLAQYVNGVRSSLGDDCATTWTTSDFLEIDVVGNVVRVLKNGTAFITSTTTLTTGFPGIGGAGNVGSIVAALDNCDFGGFDDPLPPSGDLTMILPATGALYQRPDPSVRIEWIAQNITGNVDLEYSLNGGTDYFPIATVGYNESPHFWTANVPATVSMVVRVKQSAISSVSGSFTLRGQYLK